MSSSVDTSGSEVGSPKAAAPVANELLKPASETWVLDLGNTRVKFGRVVRGSLVEVHAWPRGEQAVALAWLLKQRSGGYALLSGTGDEDFWRSSLSALAPCWSYAPGDPLPVKLYYDTPTTLGVDRLAAVVGAQAIYPQTDVMVVSLGTCMTVEYLTVAGEYLGGSISPGVGMRMRSMHEFTGKLPRVPLVLPKGVPVGTSTATALQQGAIRGAALEMNGWWVTFQQLRPPATTDPEARLLICGGDAALLHPLSPPGSELRPHLVLEGLAQLHAYALSA